MHVRVRLFGEPDAIVVVESKLTKIERFRQILQDKYDVKPKLQRLVYGGKLLENGYTFHDYNIKLNDVIQLMVCIQEIPEKEKTEVKSNEDEKKQETVQYIDAESVLYSIGDYIDMRDMKHGAWFEGRIVRIVYDPDCAPTDVHKDNQDKENNPKSAPALNGEKQANGIAKFFSKTPKQKTDENNRRVDCETDVNLLYGILIDEDEEDSISYCKLNNIRPRARTVVDVKDLKIGQKVMLNYNPEQINEKGYWYDFKVSEIVKKLRYTYELIGTVYLGPEEVPQHQTKVGVHDKIFSIEEVVPVKARTEEYKELMKNQPEKRSSPLYCLTCRDDEDAPCKDCGCYICSGKEFPEKIVLCDECNKGYHMGCHEPPITSIPDEDWYCPACKRDPNAVVAPGAAKQTKKQATKSNRDWGRGMCCVGKTKTCSMPPNHFGPIPGIEVGMCWRFRIQLSELGVHRPPVSGIHGRDVEGAYSIVLSGGYEDDVDHGFEFTYTGSGGRDLSGNKRTAEQSCDQALTRENKALARNCAVKRVNENGDDAGENWREGRPVRVVRSYKMMKHFPKYAPKEGIRYDGIYKVVKYYPETGISGFRVWKYLLRRDDPAPAPWEPGATNFSIIYPDGYLEAEAEKKALKEKGKSVKGVKPKKRVLRPSNDCSDEKSPPAKKLKRKPSDKKSPATSPKLPKGITSVFDMLKSPKREKEEKCKPTNGPMLTEKEREAIEADTLNVKLWGECLDICNKLGKKKFVEHVGQVFLCIICQEVAAQPLTTPCLHNFCMGCLKQAFKSTKSLSCPYCRHSLSKYEPTLNERLRAALRAIMPGYDAGKK